MKYLNSIVLAIFLTACTDYVQQMDEDFEEWELAQELATSSSSDQKVKSSSSLKSSSSTKSSSSAESGSSEEAPVSSNADKVSSSSVVKSAESSSSSVAYVEPCNVDGKDCCEYGTLVDARDGQNYKTVTIGTQIWMAQNLNYAIDESRCHNNVASGCSRFGRLYTWAMAMDSVGAFSNNGKGCGYAGGSIASACSPVYPVRGICPEGWHLPTGGELKILIKAVGGGTKPAVLQVVGFTAWKDATDEYGFSAIPIQADFQNPKSSVFDLAIIWGATIDESGRRSESMGINTTGIFVYPDDSGVGHYNSIRCLYDKPAEPKSSSSSSVKSSSSSAVSPQSSSSSVTVSSSSEKEVSSSSSEKVASIDVNDAPLIRDTAFMVYENLANGDLVGKIFAFDPDTIFAFCSLTYSILESDIPFFLDSNVIKVGDSSLLDYEVNPVFTFHVEVSDGEFQDTALVVVNLNDVDEMMSSSSSGKASWAYLNPSYSYGEMVDDRDGQIYKTVEIGEQTWMAENLNYAYLSLESDSDSLSFCYDNDPLNCSKYGRLYRWSAAMDSAGMFSTTGKGCGYSVCLPTGNVRGVCPEGWHLPSKNEIFNSDYSNPIYWQDSISSWYMSGLTIPASGYMGQIGGFDYKNKYAGLWTSSEVASDGYAFSLFLRYDDSFTRKDGDNKNNGYSVRCLKD